MYTAACGAQGSGHRRTLAQQQPAAYLPNLAMSLNNLAVGLSEQGDAASRTEALRVAGESVRIYAALHAEMLVAYERKLGIALRNVAKRAEALGLDADAELRRLLDP